MNYLDQINKFNLYTETCDSVSAPAQLMYYKLMQCANRAGWPEWFEVGQGTLMELAMITRKNTFYNARNELKEKGLIEFRNNKKRSKTRYHINPFAGKGSNLSVDRTGTKTNNLGAVTSSDTNSDTSSDTYSDTTTVTTSDTNSDTYTDTNIVPKTGQNNVSSLDNYIYINQTKPDQTKPDQVVVGVVGTTPQSPNGDTVQDGLDPKEMIEFWNAHRGSMSELRSLRGKRLNMLKARIKEFSLSDVKDAIVRAGKSDFLNGHSESGWIASFDWIIKPNNFPKVLEGNYDNRDTVQTKTVKTNARNPQASGDRIQAVKELEDRFFETFRKEKSK